MKYLYITCLLFVVFWLGVAVEKACTPQKATQQIPTVIEIQRMVGAEEDGIIGPETIKLWDRAICDRYAKEAMERAKK